MKFENVVDFSFYRSSSDVREDKTKPLIDEVPFDEEKVVSKDSKAALLEAIYAPHPISGFPTGDIACYVSDKTSPEVKNFILQNIMIDTSAAKLPSAPAGVDDEVIESLMRRDNESSFDYASRINDYMQSEVNNINQAIENAKRQKAVSDSPE